MTTLEVEEIKKLTERAMLATIDGEDYWLPLAQVENADAYAEGDRDVEITIPDWLAREEGLD